MNFAVPARTATVPAAIPCGRSVVNPICDRPTGFASGSPSQLHRAIEDGNEGRGRVAALIPARNEGGQLARRWEFAATGRRNSPAAAGHGRVGTYAAVNPDPTIRRKDSREERLLLPSGRPGQNRHRRRKTVFPLLYLGFALIADAAPLARSVSVTTNAPSSIELRDQFESLHKLSFPSTNLTLLTIADHKGAEQVANWVAPVHARYGPRVIIRGIADVSAVPAWLRGVVRKKFRQRQSYPVMLDWSGDTVKAFAAAQNCVNVFVVDDQGCILKRFTGEAKPGALAELYATIDRALNENRHSVAKQ